MKRFGFNPLLLGLLAFLAIRSGVRAETNDLVLDLRFADGRDYKAAANAADRFLSTEQPVLDWDEGTVRSTAKADAIKVPVAVLVNQETGGAAEALAAALRETDAAVLIG